MKLFIKSSIIILISLICCLICSISYAEGNYYVTLGLYGDSQVREGETIDLDLDICGINAGEGISGIDATLVYNSDIFEHVYLSGNNGWNVGFAESTGRFIAIRNSKVSGTGNILTISLKVRDGVDADNATVTVKNICASGGMYEDGGTGDIDVSRTSTSFGIIVDNPVQYEENYDEVEYYDESEIEEIEEIEEIDQEEDTETVIVSQERKVQLTNRSLSLINDEIENKENVETIETVVATEENKQQETVVPEGLLVSEKTKVSKAFDDISDLKSSISDSTDTRTDEGAKLTRNIRIAITVILVTVVIIFGYILIKKASTIIL